MTDQSNQPPHGDGHEHTQPLSWGAPTPSEPPADPPADQPAELPADLPAPYAGASYPSPQQPSEAPTSTWGYPVAGQGYGQAYGQSYEQAYQGYDQPSHTSAPVRGKVSRWVWPGVAALALVVGLLGGALGGAAVQALQDADDNGTVNNGINGVDTVSVPPIEAGNESVAAVAKALLPSTVQIMADLDGQPLGATGSGWVFDKQGHIITNNHVIAGAADGGDIEIVDHSGRQYTAELIGRSSVYDLAVLYVPEAKKLQPVSLGASKAMNVGDQVVAIGSPLGLNETVTSGIVSALNRPVTTGDSADDTSYINAVQTDAAINPGNSGGPLVNMQGQVIGVNSAIATTGGSSTGTQSGNIGVGFAIPVEQVITTADQILKTGKAQYPVIGAKVLTGDQDGKRGAVIDEVMSNTPADDAGLEKGDLVTAVDGQSITDGASLIVQIRTHRPGDTITLTVDRDGDTRDVEVTLSGEDG
ncbi:S1C family serine protease [Nocardioides sp.]|uniref:S1C family serine protease n=1 Tax=Nocardioides sp. TaxID=35761 RepID=UPI003D0C62F8